MDMEQLVDSVCGVYWSAEIMKNEVWAALMACRSTLWHCGYRSESEEYKTITFLLEIHRQRYR